MSFKTIIACLNAPETASAVAASALGIAEQHEAHVIGFHAIPRVPIYGLAGTEFPVEVVNREEEALRERAKEIEKLFVDAVKKTASATNVASEWRSREARFAKLSAAVLQQLPEGDLLVISQYPGAKDDPETTAEIVMGAGRPVLMIPGGATPQAVGTHAVIAWNNTRESRRTAFDALPLLQRAESVVILTVNPDGMKTDDDRVSAEDLASALSRHGVKAGVKSSNPTDIPVGDDLLSRIEDESCDLLVMGCYGHTRLREMMFGGVTRHVLKHMTVPVLMSH